MKPIYKAAYYLSALTITIFLFITIFSKSAQITREVNADELIQPQSLHLDTLTTFQTYSGGGVPNSNFGIYVMKYYRDELYIGISACVPLGCPGGLLTKFEGDNLIPILRDVDGVPTNIYKEDGIHDIDVYNDKMYILGTDPAFGDGWELGNVYTFTPEEGIIKFRTLPNTVHSLGQTHIGDTWYVSTGNINSTQTQNYSSLFASLDGGNTWNMLAQTGNYRAYDILNNNNFGYFIIRDVGAYVKIKRTNLDDASLTLTEVPIVGYGYSVITPSIVARLTRLEDKIIGITSSNGIFSIKNSSGNATLHTLPGGRLPVQQFNPIAVDNDGYVYIITTNKEVIRTKNLYTWELVASIPATGSLAALTYNDNTNVLAVSSIGTDANVWLLNLNEIQSLPVIGTDPYLTKISGISYLDQDKDGQYDNGETKLENVAMNLKSLSGELLETTQTDINGYYEFVYMPVTNDLNNYYVEQVQPDGLVSIQIPTNRFDFSINAYNTSIPNVNFGESDDLPKLSGYVYLDKNNDGQKSANEKGIKNVFIYLEKQQDASTKIFNVISSKTTNDNGYFEFANLLPGKYQIKEVQPKYIDGKDTLGTIGGEVSSDDVFSDIDITSYSGERYLFGELSKKISGRVFNEVTKSPIVGVKIEIITTEGQVLGATYTNADGYYEFDEMPQGVYLIMQTQPEGYRSGNINPSNVAEVDFSFSDIWNVDFSEVYALAETGKRNFVLKVFSKMLSMP
ncbi:carboxypeptidase regulatory-like domain-containing protein [bacterium]|nr:MAG: carboxypeptidase regulatory-like domain-containing protein [bacterium]